MPDASSRHGVPAPSDWSTAFAALPAETPPADGWSRLSAALDARGGARAPSAARSPRRRRWPVWTAAAAALAVMALVPIALQRGTDTPEPGRIATANAPAKNVPAKNAPATIVPAPDRSAEPAPTPSIAADTRPSAPSSQDIAASAPAIATRELPGKIAGTQRKPHPKARQPQRRAPAPVIESASAEPATALAAADATDVETAEAAAIAQWQAESAQLEALVALARDERVGSAGATLMSADLDSRIGVIDAALRQDGLPAAQRASLWEQRVQTLRDLAGVESTQRWLAAHGERYDGALVRVD
ncbi:hypothetical protein ASD78_04240 [Lysobacter sp. Root667]|uniref:hypothetical protein n=1 Tax=Lysobacter sp. Root667 TaxID=1736581 RepID=UPI0006FB164D|nr:hypothetical protein [Lysobacter sp. Root667]KRA76843.1 hypothetical protein ASD78_04240 [Lysobacter sp. Root667]